MPVTTPHPDYSVMAPLWAMIRDAVAGEVTVKAKGTAYLAQLSGMDAADYAAYVQNARFYNATAQSIAGYLGAAFRTSPVVQGPTEVHVWERDITLDGVPLAAFLKQQVSEKLQTGRYGILVDRDPSENSRVKWSAYPAESILSWRWHVQHGQRVLTRVVLKEDYEVPGKDEFEVASAPQYRVLDLDEQGRYRQRLFRQEHATQSFVVTKEFAPTRRGQRLDWIPFVFDGMTDLTPTVEKPPLLDLVCVNFGHYRTTADYYDALLFTSKPQPIVGTKKKVDKLRIGSRVAWVLDPGDLAMYLEYTGAGIGELRQALQDDEDRMARLGASVMTAPRVAVETAETARIHEAGKTSVLASIVGTTSLAATQALQWAAWWGAVTELREDPDIAVILNTEFVESQMPVADLEALFRVLQSQGISRDTYFYNLKRGGVYPESRTIEEEKALIDADAPALPRAEEEALDAA